MLKVAFVCAVACSSTTAAFAGERSVAPPGLHVLPTRAIPLRSTPPRTVPLRDKATVAQSSARTAAIFVLPTPKRAAYDLQARPALQQFEPVGYRPAEMTPVSPFALPEPRPLPAWQLTGRFPEVTARSGARYAVGEALANHRRVGPPRSALDAMLVLRIDGNGDSPAFRLDGGVAGAMWEAGNNPHQ